MWSWLKRLIIGGTTKKTVMETSGKSRRVRINEEPPSDRFVLIVGLMIIFFAGLVFLEVVHMIWMGTWNDVIFNGIMLVVGTIVGAVWGKSTE
ncbi:hypothetical protein JXL21_10425 [Candidatus Bathyarchaeota archaeon]|nr:hypothetical protein [Candidatus Bathyarchaeota archaeon]